MVGKKQVSISLSVNWVWTIVIASLLLMVAYALIRSEWRPMLTFVAATLAVMAGLLTAVNNLDQRAAQTRTARISGALDFFRRWNAPEFSYCKGSGREVVHATRNMQTDDEKYSHIIGDPKRLANLINVLNFFEALHIAVATEAIDPHIAKRFFRSIVLEYWHATEPYIKKRRAERSNARLYCEFEELYKLWKDS